MKDQRYCPRVRRPRSRSAFTLIELLVVIMIIIILAGILMPSLVGARIQMLRTKCADNLKNVAKACLSYAQDSSKHRGPGVAKRNVLPTVGTSGFANSADGLWLLIKYEFVGRQYFLCPEAELRRGFSAPAEADTAFEQNDSTKRYTLSYAYLSQEYQSSSGHGYATNPAAKPAGDIYPGMIILADDNPHCSTGGFTSGVPELTNSENHRGEGENIADCAGAVRWVEDPRVEVTANQLDNIYVQGLSGASSASDRSSIDDVYVIP